MPFLDYRLIRLINPKLNNCLFSNLLWSLDVIRVIRREVPDIIRNKNRRRDADRSVYHRICPIQFVASWTGFRIAIHVLCGDFCRVLIKWKNFDMMLIDKLSETINCVPPSKGLSAQLHVDNRRYADITASASREPVKKIPVPHGTCIEDEFYVEGHALTRIPSRRDRRTPSVSYPFPVRACL